MVSPNTGYVNLPATEIFHCVLNRDRKQTDNLSQSLKYWLVAMHP